MNLNRYMNIQFKQVYEQSIWIEIRTISLNINMNTQFQHLI